MLSSARQYLRVAALIAVSGMLSACATHKPACDTVAEEDEISCAPHSDGSQDCFRVPQGKKCPIEYNIAQCFFSDAYLQIETKTQMRELLRALNDALELPIEELQKPRYSEDATRPNRWTFDVMVSRYFFSGATIRGWGRAGPSTEGFYPALKLPETVTVIKKWIQEVEDSIQHSVVD